MSYRSGLPFFPVQSTSPAFNATADESTGLIFLQSSALNRLWQGPHGRAVRLVSTAVRYYVGFGSSLTSIVGTTNGTLMLANQTEIFTARAGDVCLYLVSSTAITVNVTLGYGQ